MESSPELACGLPAPRVLVGLVSVRPEGFSATSLFVSLPRLTSGVMPLCPASERVGKC